MYWKDIREEEHDDDVDAAAGAYSLLIAGGKRKENKLSKFIVSIL